MAYRLKDSDWHTYHYSLSKLKTDTDRSRYAKYYNRCLDLYINNVGVWPPSITDVNGSDNIERKNAQLLECATTDAIQDIIITARDTHPRHAAFIIGKTSQSTEAFRIWQEESKENGWPGLLEQLRITTQEP